MVVKKEDILEELKKKVDDLNYRWSIERNKLEAMAQHQTAEVRKKFEKEREELRNLRSVMKEKLIDLEVAGENAWDDVKVGAEEAWKALSTAFDKASGHFKK